MRIGKYEFGKTLGEGNFGKVKHAKNVESGKEFAAKILDKQKILQLKISDQIKREIGTLKLLKHPNVIRLYEVLASKTKICMILEYVTGGELFDKIALKGRLKEKEAVKLFQQLIDGVSYCHDKGVFHRDLKPENILVDESGNIKISDFGLSALPQHFKGDGLLHTTCGSPNYVAPEVLSNRGYDGATSDIWSCGVILYVMLTGSLPFDDRNLAVLYQKIFKGDFVIPKWLSLGAQKLIKRILDPNPKTRVTASEIKEDIWFKQHYVPATPYEDEDGECYLSIDKFGDTFSFSKTEEGKKKNSTFINAFQLIGMSSGLDLSGFFEEEVDFTSPFSKKHHEDAFGSLKWSEKDASERKIRFASDNSAKDLLEKIEYIATQMGLRIQKTNGKLKVVQIQDLTSTCSLSVATEVFEVNPSLHVVELRKSHGDRELYRQLCTNILSDLGVDRSRPILTPTVC